MATATTSVVASNRRVALAATEDTTISIFLIVQSLESGIPNAVQTTDESYITVPLSSVPSLSTVYKNVISCFAASVARVVELIAFAMMIPIFIYKLVEG